MTGFHQPNVKESVPWWVQRNDHEGDLIGRVPQFVQSTGGMLRSAELEEKYGITWVSQEERGFELPTGGAALMHEGQNVMYFARKEQCLALSRHLKKLKPGVKEYDIYRIYPGQDPLLIHTSKDKPEKMGKERPQVNTNMRKTGDNPSPHTVKFSDKNTFD